ncbi:MAG: hypothetical protein HWD62_16600 [Cyclobacteriaceae bacterium]|nr:MAG: hypothetical protein HWD62_16600 [Cyclobacteriaceae bacterium]
MVTYNSGPKTLTTPAGNSKLADLANKFSALTGKSINRKTAQDFIDRMTKKYGAIEEVNLLNEKYLKDGELDFDQLEKTSKTIRISRKITTLVITSSNV